MKLITNESDLLSLVGFSGRVTYWVDGVDGDVPPDFPFLADMFIDSCGVDDVICCTVDHAEELVEVARRMMPVLE